MKGTAHQVLIIKGTMIHNYEILIMKGRTIVIHDYPRYDDHQSSILIMELKRYCSPATDNERYKDHQQWVMKGTTIIHQLVHHKTTIDSKTVKGNAH